MLKHSILLRQLKHSGLSTEVSPTIEQWQNFLARVDLVYQEADQDRYLIERSQEIASREMQTLHKNMIELHQDLVTAARRAGMADVATNVLHNVGNVLNSVNVSVSLLNEKMQRSKLDGLNQIATLLQDNSQDINKLLCENEQGKHLREYLLKLADYWKDEKNFTIDDLTTLTKNVQHIKDIINTQQSLSGASGLVELIKLSEVVEDALKINISSIEKAKITVIRNYKLTTPIFADKIKLQQILVNLITNAKDALNGNAILANKKQMALYTKLTKQGLVKIQIADNGCGITKENKKRIFSHGFTTKKTGHGYGLHTSALYAKEMNGHLTAHSHGLGHGSIFTLEFPAKTDTAAQ